MKNRYELHEERLSSTDEHGHRVYIHPEDVQGKWRNRRTLFYWFLIILYLVLPWLHYKGKQTILLDIVRREFTFFGLTFYAHDAPILLLVFLIFLFAMGFITSLWGRAWCGWGCPQTVFIDAIYRNIERLIEGKSRRRERLDQMPWNLEKISKRSLKWFLFLIVSLHISHSFLGYFVGTRELFFISLSPPTENMTLFTIMVFITAVFLFDFGWFREQFCIIACPYGRIQSVMMDDDSLTVLYDKTRSDDCVNCYHCVKVCPTGIDIRRGTQLECIACTNCIDACDNIMDKVKKPRGLIRYDSENALKKQNQHIKPKRIKLRSIIYLAAIIAASAILTFAISNAQSLKVTMTKGMKSPYQEIKETNLVRNIYKVRLDYKGVHDLNLDFKVKDQEFAPYIKIFTPRRPVKLTAGKPKVAIVHFNFPSKILRKGSRIITLQVFDGDLVVEEKVNLVGPFR